MVSKLLERYWKFLASVAFGYFFFLIYRSTTHEKRRNWTRDYSMFSKSSGVSYPADLRPILSTILLCSSCTLAGTRVYKSELVVEEKR